MDNSNNKLSIIYGVQRRDNIFLSTSAQYQIGNEWAKLEKNVWSNFAH